MQNTLRPFFTAVATLWVVLCIAAYFYSQDKNIPTGIAVFVVPAFLLEAALYLGAGVPAVRSRLESLPRRALAFYMTMSAGLPYLLYSVPTGVFAFQSLLTVLGLAGLASWWYLACGQRAWADVGYLLLMAAPVLLKVFPQLYIDPFPKLQVFVLGVLMWYRTGILSVLVLRGMDGIGFSFVPRAKEWLIGLRNYAFILPLGLGLAVLLGFAQLRPDPVTGKTLLLAAATFLGVFWVLAVAEEFFFRGLLQQLLTRGFRSEIVGLVLASLIFGAAHLGFRSFPNWRFALLATVAGLFYGRAYLQARSIRAAMVTHALVVTTWRVFLV